MVIHLPQGHGGHAQRESRYTRNRANPLSGTAAASAEHPWQVSYKEHTVGESTRIRSRSLEIKPVKSISSLWLLVCHLVWRSAAPRGKRSGQEAKPHDRNCALCRARSSHDFCGGSSGFPGLAFLDSDVSPDAARRCKQDHSISFRTCEWHARTGATAWSGSGAAVAMSRAGSKAMDALKLVLVILGIGIFGSASALVVYDVMIAAQLRRMLKRTGASYLAPKRNPMDSNQAIQGNALVPERWRRTATSV